MKASEIIKDLTKTLNLCGDIRVFLQGLDEGGIYPNDYRTWGLTIREEDGFFYFAEDIDCDTMTITQVIKLIQDFIKKCGDVNIGIGYGDSGGTYDGFDEELAIYAIDYEDTVVDVFS